MIDIISDLVRQLVIIIFLATFLELLLPKSDFNRYIRMITGVMIILIIITPLHKVFGILPDLESVLVYSDNKIDGEHFLQHEIDLQRSNEELIIEEYRQNIYERVSQEININGQWKVVSVDADIEENFESPNIGEIKSLNVVIERNNQNNDNQNSNLIAIEKVDILIDEKSKENILPRKMKILDLDYEIKNNFIDKLSTIFNISKERISIILIQ